MTKINTRKVKQTQYPDPHTPQTRRKSFFSLYLSFILVIRLIRQEKQRTKTLEHTAQSGLHPVLMLVAKGSHVYLLVSRQQQTKSKCNIKHATKEVMLKEIDDKRRGNHHNKSKRDKQESSSLVHPKNTASHIHESATKGRRSCTMNTSLVSGSGLKP